MSVGQRIAQKRKELGLSQEALGEQLGVSRQSISNSHILSYANGFFSEGPGTLFFFQRKGFPASPTASPRAPAQADTASCPARRRSPPASHSRQ
ncbi:MAG: helix-turn-helix transcriptional regulator [Clostridia bacterium]|nr:helix-turn-helix transcriptional regulator [Clostridia bacterium]